MGWIPPPLPPFRVKKILTHFDLIFIFKEQHGIKETFGVLQLYSFFLATSMGINAQTCFVTMERMDTNGLHTIMDHLDTLLVPAGIRVWDGAIMLVQSCSLAILMVTIEMTFCVMTNKGASG